MSLSPSVGERKRLVVVLMAAGLVLGLAAAFLLVYTLGVLPWGRRVVGLVALGVAVSGFVTLGLGLVGLILSVVGRGGLVPAPLLRLTLTVILPVALALARPLRIDGDRVRASFIALNNHLTDEERPPVTELHGILVLLPGCLQHASCRHRVTESIDNCRRCGVCPVGACVSLSERLGCQVVVVTGGTLARRIVAQRRPRAIVAVACERDLASGIQDTRPLPVVGVVNQRPHGPCYNTTVDVDEVEAAVLSLAGGARARLDTWREPREIS